MLGIRKGWRPTSRGLEYCKEWEEEDEYLSSTEVMKRCVSSSLNGIHSFLRFTSKSK